MISYNKNVLNIAFLNLFLTLWPSYAIIWYRFDMEPPKDHSREVWSKSSKLFIDVKLKLLTDGPQTKAFQNWFTHIFLSLIKRVRYHCKYKQHTLKHGHRTGALQDDACHSFMVKGQVYDKHHESNVIATVCPISLSRQTQWLCV